MENSAAVVVLCRRTLSLPCGAGGTDCPGIGEGGLAHAEGSWSVAAGSAWCFFQELEVTVASLVVSHWPRW